MTQLVLAGFTCFLAGIAADLVFGARDPRWRVVPYAFGAIGSACLVAVGACALAGSRLHLSLGRLLEIQGASLRVDQLTGLFLVITAGVAVAVCLCSASWVRPADRAGGRGLGALFLVLLASVSLILVAGDAFTFLFGWESLTLAFYGITAFPRLTDDGAHASWVTAGFGKASGGFLFAGFLLLAGASGSVAFASWHDAGSSSLRAAAFLLLALGFGIKLGLVPFHLWMPRSYAAAPGPARAVMAGVAVNVGAYGLWRTLDLLGAPPVWLAIVVLLLGSVTALLGITFASVQSDLQRLLAFSSIENGGLIATAYGVALVGAAVHQRQIVAVGLLAATLQVISHALAKAALFSSSANFEAATSTSDLDRLSGVGRPLAWSGSSFAVGALTLAGLPPTIGFVSEWFILEALLQQFRLHQLAPRLAMAGAGALVALTAGIAALTFVRVLGLSVLGARWRGRLAGRETGSVGRAGLLLLAAPCLVIAAVTPLEIRLVATGLGDLVPGPVTRAALSSPWILQPVTSDFSILSPSWLWIALPTLVVIAAVFSIAASGGRLVRVRRVQPWVSAGGGVAGQSHYTSFAYANPIRHILANFTRTRQELRVVDDRHDEVHAELATSMADPVEHYAYRPLGRAISYIVDAVRRVQSGRLDAYVAYMLLALLIALATVAAMR